MDLQSWQWKFSQNVKLICLHEQIHLIMQLFENLKTSHIIHFWFNWCDLPIIRMTIFYRNTSITMIVIDQAEATLVYTYTNVLKF